MIDAYETLPGGLKERIEGRVAIHDGAHNSTGQLRKGYKETADVRETPGARHLLVCTDPDTGRITDLDIVGAYTTTMAAIRTPDWDGIRETQKLDELAERDVAPWQVWKHPESQAE